jgi:hypothetical protein
MQHVCNDAALVISVSLCMSVSLCTSVCLQLEGHMYMIAACATHVCMAMPTAIPLHDFTPWHTPMRLRHDNRVLPHTSANPLPVILTPSHHCTCLSTLALRHAIRADRGRYFNRATQATGCCINMALYWRQLLTALRQPCRCLAHDQLTTADDSRRWHTVRRATSSDELIIGCCTSNITQLFGPEAGPTLCYKPV